MENNDKNFFYLIKTVFGQTKLILENTWTESDVMRCVVFYYTS